MFGAAVWASGGGDAVVGVGGVEVAEAVVMFCGKDDVFSSGLFGDAGPFVGIEIRRVEGCVEVEPLLPLDFGVGRRQRPDHARFRLRPGAEVDEKAELCVLPVVLVRRGVLCEGR